MKTYDLFLLSTIVLARCGSNDLAGSAVDSAGASDAGGATARDAANGATDAVVMKPVTDTGSFHAGDVTAGDSADDAIATDAQETPDATDAGDAALPPPNTGMIAGVDVHNYPQPTAYGYTAADGKDRMGDALGLLGAPVVRGANLGDTTFLARLASFGVKEVVLQLSASAEGKPFDPAAVGRLLTASLDAAKALGLIVQVEGLNEWDLFNTRSYNAGVLPDGMSASDFILYTQKALYEAAHPLGVSVLGPTVGHPDDPTHLAFFPDVGAYVDVVNMHCYFTFDPEAIPIATRVADHQHFQGAGKPLWVTETGISSYGSVTEAAQADVIRRGLGLFAASTLIARAYLYELLENQQPSPTNPDSGEYHFGLFTFAGAPKPAAKSFQDFVGVP